MPHHIPGKPNSGILSGRPGYNEGIDDNDDITMLPDNLFKIDALFIQEVIMQELTPTSFMTSIIQDRLDLDKSVAQTLEKTDFITRWNAYVQEPHLRPCQQTS